MGTIVRRLDANHDMTFGRGMQDIAIGSESTEQRAACRLMVIQGEWFLDTGDGLPWWQPSSSGIQPIMGGPKNIPYAEALIKKCLLETDGIDQIVRVDMGYNSATRRLSPVATVKDVDGEVIVVGTGEFP